MHQVLSQAANAIASYLENTLPSIDSQGWNTYVLDKLSFQQRQIAIEKGFTSLTCLDLAGLLRVFDQNWQEIRQHSQLPFEARNWLKEAQSIRNRWAHLSASTAAPSAEDRYRDLDTMLRLLTATGTDEHILLEISNELNEAREAMGGSKTREIIVEPKASDSTSEIHRGDVVSLKSDPNTRGAVVDINAKGGETRYSVFHDGNIVIYYASQLERVNLTPQRNHVSAAELHASLSALQLRHPSTTHLYSLFASRINFVPYQFRPALKIIQSDRPRLLIADEVGVGKTIEAGLILKELQARRDIRSVLIICPKPLVAEKKWQEELKRFDEQFLHLDGSTLRYCLDETHLDGAWPQQYAKAILPYSLLDENLLLGRQRGKQRQRGLLDLDPAPIFDLVIVDEAHHVRNTDTWAYRNVRYFCDNAEAVALLSATPIQLGDNDLFNLLHLLRPDILPTRREFEHMAEPNPHINAAIEEVRRAGPNWREDAREYISQAVDTSWGKGVLATNPKLQNIYDTLGREDSIAREDRLNLVQHLEQLYTFFPMINRTRRRDIGSFTTRKPETVTVEFTPEQEELHRRLITLISRMLAHRHGDQNLKFMLTTLRRQLASCVFGLAPMLQDILNRHLSHIELYETDEGIALEDIEKVVLEFKADVSALVECARAIPRQDPKFDAFLKIVRDKQKVANNKLLVFSTFRHTLSYLHDRLMNEPIRIGLIHGDVPDFERRELRKRFSLPKEDPHSLDVLLSSEVGCEGLDFQFCDGMVNYDLPWNPMRVEQRIGRIDRYGQRSEAVVIYNLITPGTVDAEIYERCLLRIGVFREALGGSEEILGRLTKEIRDIAENLVLSPSEQSARLQQLADNEVRIIQEQARLEDEQSKLFGLTLPSRDSDLIKRASSFWLSPSRLANLIQRYLETIDASLPARPIGSKPVTTLRLGQEVRNRLLEDFKLLNSRGTASRDWEQWIKGSEPDLRITFDQETASDHRELMFITPTHALSRQAAQALEPSEAMLSTLSATSSCVKPGRYPYAIYQWRKRGVREDFLFQPVTLNDDASPHIVELLEIAATAPDESPLSAAEEEQLEAAHYKMWSEAKAHHAEEVYTTSNARIASLETTHSARIALLEDQRDMAGDERIRRMRDSQIITAQQDYQRRLLELQEAGKRGDIVAEPVVFGVLLVTGA